MLLEIQHGSFRSFIPSVTQIDKDTFDTETILTNDTNDPKGYIVMKVTNTTHRIITTIKVINKYQLFHSAPKERANLLVLPYYGGNDYQEVVSYNKTKDTFIILEKLRTFDSWVLNVMDEVRYYTNSILGTVNRGYYPTSNPKYKGDCDTEITVINTKAYYYAKI